MSREYLIQPDGSMVCPDCPQGGQRVADSEKHDAWHRIVEEQQKRGPR